MLQVTELRDELVGPEIYKHIRLQAAFDGLTVAASAWASCLLSVWQVRRPRVARKRSIPSTSRLVWPFSIRIEL